MTGWDKARYAGRPILAVIAAIEVVRAVRAEQWITTVLLAVCLLVLVLWTLVLPRDLRRARALDAGREKE